MKTSKQVVFFKNFFFVKFDMGVYSNEWKEMKAQFSGTF